MEFSVASVALCALHAHSVVSLEACRAFRRIVLCELESSEEVVDRFCLMRG